MPRRHSQQASALCRRSTNGAIIMSVHWGCTLFKLNVLSSVLSPTHNLSAQIAKRQAVVNPENTFFSVKRFIGRKMNEVKDESKQVRTALRSSARFEQFRCSCLQRLVRTGSRRVALAPGLLCRYPSATAQPGWESFLMNILRSNGMTGSSCEPRACTAISPVEAHKLKRRYWATVQVPYRVVEDGSGNVKIACPNAKRDFAPEEISAQVLRKLTEDGAKFLNDTVRALPMRPWRRLILHIPPHGPDSATCDPMDGAKSLRNAFMLRLHACVLVRLLSPVCLAIVFCHNISMVSSRAVWCLC